ncbi:MAG: response regulator [Rhodospirillaceae bacterium]|nr:response regulator [Rhodospirillaceae bacterium]
MENGIKHCSILVVDDNASSRTILTSALNEIGFGYVRSVSNGAMAMSHLLQSVDSPMNGSTPPVDIVLSEWGMDPVGGLILAHWIRMSKNSPNRFLRMGFVSGNLDAEKVELSRSAGVNGAMTKPFTMAKLKTHITNIITANPVFVKTPSYFGPTRRRRSSDVTLSERRHMRDITNEDLGQGTHPQLGGFNLPNYMAQIMDGTPREQIDYTALNWAHTLLQKWSEDYADWIKNDIAAMRIALGIIVRGESHRVRAMSLLHGNAVRMIREGEAMNYPLISAFARTLKAAFEGTQGNTKQVLDVAETSIQGLEAVVNAHAAGRGGDVANALEVSLMQMEKKLGQINPRHEGYHTGQYGGLIV